ncbi:MAG: helix-turn-helix domain-containing protein, partial [Dehalococcoidia bacterium]
MSVKALARAWDHSTHKGSDLLVLVAIAENSNDDTDSTYLSIEFICWKSRLSRRSVQRSIQELERSGELLIQRNRGRNGTNVYRINTTPGNYVARPSIKNARFDASGVSQ